MKLQLHSQELQGANLSFLDCGWVKIWAVAQRASGQHQSELQKYLHEQGQGFSFKRTCSTGLHSSVLLVFYAQMHQRTEPVNVGKRVTDGLSTQ